MPEGCLEAKRQGAERERGRQTRWVVDETGDDLTQRLHDNAAFSLAM